jgi:SOS-response transcriptional repressor LexA
MTSRSTPTPTSVATTPPEESVHAPPSASDKAFALRVHGDSMVNPAGGPLSFPAESIIVVDPNILAAPGDPVVVKLRDAEEVAFRMFEFDGREYSLKPLNSHYPEVPMPADARVVGVVISVQVEIGRRAAA